MEICEIFGNTIQGEGPYAGRPATFIRTAGCLAPFCDFCDSKFSWKKGVEMSINDIVDKVVDFYEESSCSLVVITGGEPYLQKDLYKLIKHLNTLQFDVQIETSGKVKVRKSEAFVVLSPKQYDGKFVVQNSAIKNAKAYKFVVDGEHENFNNVINFIDNNKIKKEKCYLMPLTVYNKEKAKKILQKVWDLCSRTNMRFSPRLHNEVWGIKKRRV